MTALRTLLAALAAVLLATACVSKPPAPPTPVDNSGTLHRARQAQDELSSGASQMNR